MALFLLLLGYSTISRAQVVGTVDRSYLVTYPNGSTETYIAEYTASMNVNRWESGHPSEPLRMPPWLTDTRQCHWEITSQIKRRIALVSVSAQTYWSSGFTQPYLKEMTGKGSDFIVINMASENCGQALARFESDVNDVKSHLTGALDAVIKMDTPRAVSDITAQTASGVSVVSKDKM